MILTLDISFSRLKEVDAGFTCFVSSTLFSLLSALGCFWIGSSGENFSFFFLQKFWVLLLCFLQWGFLYSSSSYASKLRTSQANILSRRPPLLWIVTLQLVASRCPGLLWTRKRGLVPSLQGGSHLLLGRHSSPPNSIAGKEVWPATQAEFFGPSPCSRVSEVDQHSGFGFCVLCEEVDYRPWAFPSSSLGSSLSYCPKFLGCKKWKVVLLPSLSFCLPPVSIICLHLFSFYLQLWGLPRPQMPCSSCQPRRPAFFRTAAE